MNRGGDLGLLINSDLSKTAGSPAFFAPELCSPLDDTPTNELDYQRPGRVIIPSTKAGSVINPPIGATIDIWATGITLYCLVYGKIPFSVCDL